MKYQRHCCLRCSPDTHHVSQEISGIADSQTHTRPATVSLTSYTRLSRRLPAPEPPSGAAGNDSGAAVGALVFTGAAVATE